MRTTNYYLIIKRWGQYYILLIFIFIFFNRGESQHYFCPMVTPPHNENRSTPCDKPSDSGTYLLPVVFHNFSGEELRQSYITGVMAKFKTNLNRDQEGEPFTQTLIPVLAKYDVDGGCFPGVISYGAKTFNYNTDELDDFIDAEFPNGSFGTFADRYINVILFEDIIYGQGETYGLSPFPGTTTYPAIGLNFGSAPFITPIDPGNILAHEFGHFCNLYHTHADSQSDHCDPDLCNGQDEIITTVPGPFIGSLGFSYICGDATYCNGLVFDHSNLMTYGRLFIHDVYNCNSKWFVQEQMNRLTFYLNEYHSGLFTQSNLNLTLGLDQIDLQGEVVFENETLNNEIFEALSNTVIKIRGTVTMNNCIFQLGWDSKVIVESNANLFLNNTKFNSDCSAGQWFGIYVEQNGKVNSINQSTISGAKIGIEAEYDTQIQMTDANFYDCGIGAKLGTEGASGWIYNYFIRCNFFGRHNGSVDRGPNPFTFPLPDFGILAYSCGGLFVIDNTKFRDIQTAIYSEENLNYLYNNNVLDCFNGFDLYNLKSKNISVVAHNTINCLPCTGLNPTCKGYGVKIVHGQIIVTNNDIKADHGLDVSGVEPYLGEPIGIRANDIYNCGKREIGLKTTRDIKVELNTDKLTSSKEIYAADNVNLNFNENYFPNASLVNKFSRFSKFENNILNNIALSSTRFERYIENSLLSTANITSSPSNTYICNYVSDPTSFRRNCMGSDIVANIFYYEFNLQGPATIISRQVDKGNDFSSVTANYNTDVQNLEDNIFVVKNSPPYVPLVIDGPQDWFIPNGSADQAECEYNRFYDEPWGEDHHTKCIDSLFQGTRYAIFSAQQKWSILMTLYRIYSERQEAFPFEISPCAIKVLNLNQNNNIGKLTRLYDQIDSFRTITPVGNEINAMNLLIDDLLNISENNPTDSILLATWEDVTFAHMATSTLRLSYLQGYNILKTSILSQAEDLVIESTEDPAICLAQLVPYLVANYENDTTFFDVQKLNFLYDLAMECDDIAGEAKYIAAMIYENQTNIRINTDSDCISFPELRSKTNLQNSTIYPNPAMDMMTIQTVEPLKVRIYSIDGTQKLHIDIPSTQTIDISALESAIYIIQTTNNAGKTNNHKLIKIGQ